LSNREFARIKALRKHVDEIDPRAQFHQHSMYSYYASVAQKRTKGSQVVSLFTLLGSALAKAARKYVGEIDPRVRERRRDERSLERV